MATPIISVISSNYCRPYSIKLTVEADTGVTISDNGVIFRVEEPSVSLHNRRVLHDVYGNPILTLYDKLRTVHGRRLVFKQGSTDSDDLLFSVKRSSFRQPRNKNINLEVFLAENTEERHCDFKVNASASSCVISRHGSSTILAKMTNKVEVEVQPNVDYAFIVALIMIVHEINHVDIDASAVIADAARITCWGLNIGANVVDIVMNCVQ